ncbi:cupin domain-containing protein [Stakelama tenebrarum]|uniref:Cupin domain-containing protein n=1 Tax=Stakelama tenebrarum TaxID=2711215 RepID=A0A6G6YA57_9SPHN|nr:cupin domain-containing protein [Sphingosinithalassobacter tenebrarum]QIG81824.1 cupin domain-containing protein [Sphingosinithalassobacter tenebrarum]
MPKLDLDTIPQTNATGYPPEYAGAVEGRWYRRLGSASGLNEFGVSHVTLRPGAWSSQRHWHEGEDEFVVMLSGEAVLVDDEGEHVMRAGDCAAFPRGEANGHVLQNRGDADCVFVAVGRPSASDCHYPDIDMHLFEGQGFRRKDGSGFD